MKKRVDTYFVGYVEPVEAAPAKEEIRDEDGNIVQQAQEAIEGHPGEEGIRVDIRLPIPFEVVLKAMESLDGSMQGMLRCGEVVLRSCVVGGKIPKEVEEDGQLMAGICSECSQYIDAAQVKKNS